MKISIKKIIRAMSIIMVVIVYITTIILSKSYIQTDNIFSMNNIIVLGVLVLIAYIVSVIVSNKCVMPIKRIEKGMRLVRDGKFPDISRIRKANDIKEYKQLTDSYISMLRVIRKNTFDLNSQQSKTEIILEHMADGVIAFTTEGQVVHMNKAAMRMLNLTENEDTYDVICSKLNLNLNFDDVMYLPNYKSVEVKADIDDLSLSIVFAPFFSDELNPMGIIMIVEFVANVSH